MSETRYLGLLSVDSGTLVVGDPGLLLPFAGRDRLGVDYQEVIDAPITEPAIQLGGRPALLVTGFGGDGDFPVFGMFDGDDLVRLTIEFVDADADD